MQRFFRLADRILESGSDAGPIATGAGIVWNRRQAVSAFPVTAALSAQQKPTDGKFRPWAMKNDGGAIG
jgi:hypothetical protein